MLIRRAAEPTERAEPEVSVLRSEQGTPRGPVDIGIIRVSVRAEHARGDAGRQWLPMLGSTTLGSTTLVPMNNTFTAQYNTIERYCE
jgi:hypothetical protein